MIMQEDAIVKITYNNKDYYKEKGYDVTTTQIKVKTLDLRPSSKTSILFKCDCCGELFSRTWRSHLQSKKEYIDGDDYCNNCRYEKMVQTKKQKYGTLSPKEIAFQKDGWDSSQEIPYETIKQDYENKGCILLLNKEDYIYGQHTIAPYICSCGNLQEGRSIYYFRHKNCLCDSCTKENVRRQKAFSLAYDYESIKKRMLSENKELLTKKEYFLSNDDIEYKCLLCGTINKIKFYTYTSGEHTCKGCRTISSRKNRWDYILSLAKESNCEILSSFDDFKNQDSRINVRCACGEIFNVIVREFVNSNKRQCNKCGLKLRSGENAPRWKGGITSENDKIRNSVEYANWRDSVFKRDNYTCQCCGDNSGHNLTAHHIRNFSDNKSLRLEKRNGITLCNECHNPNQIGSFHNLYSTHNNTPDQLQEYLNNRRDKLGLPRVNLEDIIQND